MFFPEIATKYKWALTNLGEAQTNFFFLLLSGVKFSALSEFPVEIGVSTRVSILKNVLKVRRAS